MAESVQPINLNTVKFLSRNTPVALVVGAAGFLGSHLVEGLLEKNIQVVALDDFQTGKKENLEEASKNKNLHLINNLNESFSIEFPRLDYLFITAEKSFNLDNILRIFKQTGCRCLLVSNIDLYGDKGGSAPAFLKSLEAAVAKFAHLNHLNARVLRMGPVFGPRMDFTSYDPVNKLILASLKGELQKEINLDFSTRALYVSDAVDLIIKSMLSGATALKIFDGVSPSPIKVSEVKQVLLDPVWYENKGFTPTELPPWPTPNLLKTVRELNWKPKTNLVPALKKTLNYFKDHEPVLPEVKQKEEDTGGVVKNLRAFLQEQPSGRTVASKPKKAGEPLRFLKLKRHVFFYLSTGIILYALLWPVMNLSWGVFSFKYNLYEAAKNFETGEFDKSLNNLSLANESVENAKNFMAQLEPLRKAGLFEGLFESGDNLTSLGHLSALSVKSTVSGLKALYNGLDAVTGELSGQPGDYFARAQLELRQADEGFSKVGALTKVWDFNKTIPGIFKMRVQSLTEWLTDYGILAREAKTSAVLMPEIMGLNGTKSYLVLVQDNTELRPTGGFIGSFARIDFEAGRLKKLEVSDIYAKEDLGQKDSFLRDSDFEPDFPTSARRAHWFYNKETGNSVDGVIALDLSAIESLLSVTGPVDLAEYGGKITSENLFEKAVAHAQQGFFEPQARKTFLTSVTAQVFNKIFFLPRQNWPAITAVFGSLAENRHLSIYLTDPKLFSYINGKNLTGALPGFAGEQDATADFLAPVEANLGSNKANYYLDRSYKLETLVGKDGEVSQKLRINYLNRSPSGTWPGGNYKNRFRIYLPLGTKLNRASWGEKDITSGVSNFVDYGRSGISLLLELKPKEEKALVLSYELPGKLKFVDNIARYRLDVVKQAGTLKDPFEWRISFPINYRIVSDENQKTAPQERVVSTDLSKNRAFEISFSKSL